MARMFLVTGMIAVFLASAAIAAAQDLPPDQPAGPDFSACADLQGAERGACVSALARQWAGDHNGNQVAQAARALEPVRK
jgi:hypothetical protein